MVKVNNTLRIYFDLIGKYMIQSFLYLSRARLKGGPAGQLPRMLKHHWNKSEIWHQFTQGCQIINTVSAPICLGSALYLR
jgi:hypothetical protein